MIEFKTIAFAVFCGVNIIEIYYQWSLASHQPTSYASNCGGLVLPRNPANEPTSTGQLTKTTTRSWNGCKYLITSWWCDHVSRGLPKYRKDAKPMVAQTCGGMGLCFLYLLSNRQIFAPHAWLIDSPCSCFFARGRRIGVIVFVAVILLSLRRSWSKENDMYTDKLIFLWLKSPLFIDA